MADYVRRNDTRQLQPEARRGVGAVQQPTTPTSPRIQHDHYMMGSLAGARDDDIEHAGGRHDDHPGKAGPRRRRSASRLGAALLPLAAYVCWRHPSGPWARLRPSDLSSSGRRVNPDSGTFDALTETRGRHRRLLHRRQRAQEPSCGVGRRTRFTDVQQGRRGVGTRRTLRTRHSGVRARLAGGVGNRHAERGATRLHRPEVRLEVGQDLERQAAGPSRLPRSDDEIKTPQIEKAGARSSPECQQVQSGPSPTASGADEEVQTRPSRRQGISASTDGAARRRSQESPPKRPPRTKDDAYYGVLGPDQAGFVRRRILTGLGGMGRGSGPLGRFSGAWRRADRPALLAALGHGHRGACPAWSGRRRRRKRWR